MRKATRLRPPLPARATAPCWPWLLAAALLPAGAAAQEAPAGTRLRLGASLGAGALPGVFTDDHCGQRRAGHVASILAAFQVTAARRGAFLQAVLGAEGEVTGGTDMIAVCAPLAENGTIERKIYPFSGTGITGLGVRAGLEFRRDFPLWASAGGGWLLNDDLPFVVMGAGAATRGRTRLFGVLEYQGFRVPYDRFREEWRNSYPVSRQKLGREHEWRSGVGARLGLEVEF